MSFLASSMLIHLAATSISLVASISLMNLRLSEQRARSVYDYLKGKGIAADRLEYEGKGSSEPLDPNNREVNRRTEIIVIE